MPARRRNPDEPARVRLVGFGKPRALRPAVEAFIRDVFDASHPLPFQNDYRTQRVLAHIEAVVEVLPEHGGIKIETLRALSRRKGEGTKAMRFLTDLADKHGVELYLYAKPFGDEKMPLDDLVRFYRRFGFDESEENRSDEDDADEDEGIVMVRYPERA
jgi:GNAT superfamily N-acetyltransferase